MQVIRMSIRVIQGPVAPPLPRRIVFNNELAAFIKRDKDADENETKDDEGILLEL